MILAFLLFLLVGYSYAGDATDFKSLRERKPVLSTEEIVRLAEVYLEKEKKFKTTNFKLVKLSFDYVNWGGKDGEHYDGEWFIVFTDPTSKEEAYQSINLTASNSKTPSFNYINRY